MKLLLFILTIASLYSCDPARRINMKNTSGHDAEIIWKLKEDSLHSSPFFMNLSKEIRFKLHSKPPYNLVKLSLGEGSWSPMHFKNIIEDVDSLIIYSHHGEVRLGENELKPFLWSRRMGLDKGKINIYISN